MLLYPERGLVLNAVAAEVCRRLTGSRTVATIAAEVAALFAEAPTAEVEGDVLAFLTSLHERALLEIGEAPAEGPRGVEARARPRARAGPLRTSTPTRSSPRLTYRCPLRCPVLLEPGGARGGGGGSRRRNGAASSARPLRWE